MVNNSKENLLNDFSQNRELIFEHVTKTKNRNHFACQCLTKDLNIIANTFAIYEDVRVRHWIEIGVKNLM